LGCQKLDTSAFDDIIDSMFRKIKTFIKKLFSRDDSELDYLGHEDPYIEMLINQSEKKNGNLE